MPNQKELYQCPKWKECTRYDCFHHGKHSNEYGCDISAKDQDCIGCPFPDVVCVPVADSPKDPVCKNCGHVKAFHNPRSGQCKHLSHNGYSDCGCAQFALAQPPSTTRQDGEKGTKEAGERLLTEKEIDKIHGISTEHPIFDFGDTDIEEIKIAQDAKTREATIKEVQDKFREIGYSPERFVLWLDKLLKEVGE